MRPLHFKLSEARRHRLWPAPAFLLSGVLAVGGCGGGGDEASRTEADGPTSTATASITAAEPPVNEAPVLDDAQIKSSAVSFRLKEENDSGLAGRAVLQRSGRRGTEVLLTLQQRAGEVNYTHVHDTSCEAYRDMTFTKQLATIADQLKDVEKGRSRTVVDGPVGERTTGGYSINVHEPQEPFTVVACGDVPKR